MELKLPDNIGKIVGSRDYRKDTVGMSESEIICYHDMVLKIEKEGEEAGNEYRMLQWLQGRLPVPECIGYEKAGGHQYLLMSRIDGTMLCEDIYLRQPKELIHLLAEGLKRLWKVDISGCPYNNGLDNKFRLAKYRIEHNLCSMEDAEPGTYADQGFRHPRELLEWLMEHRPEEQYVFSHGDYCLPNIFAKDKRISGFIDLGRAGLADQWQDIALCVRSIEHNLGRNNEYGEQLFEELGMKPDMAKIRYYILLDELF